MQPLSRRQFLKHTTASTVALSAAAPSLHAQGANQKVVVAIAGLRVRGTDLAPIFAQHPDVEVRYIVDVDTNLFRRALRETTREIGHDFEAKTEKDFRRVLDDPDVDALIVATPDHWHALASIWALQAGKHVYCEKPACHSIWEGQQMIAAEKRYGKVLAVGLQNRSAAYVHAAREYIRDKAFGDVHYIRVIDSIPRFELGEHEDGQVPKGVDYDLWLGPAEQRPFNKNHFHYNWHWFWQYSGGETLNNGVHQLDLVRFLTDAGYPKTVSAAGGMLHFDDDQETPDTLAVNYEFDGLVLSFEQLLWAPYMKMTPAKLRDDESLPQWMFNGTRIEIYGSKQQLFLGRHGGGWQAFNGAGESVRIEHGRWANPEHVDNFIRSIQGEATPNTPILEGHRSTLLAHYANISHRLGRKLHIDPKTELFLDDPEACNDFLAKRTYRAPFAVPQLT